MPKAKDGRPTKKQLKRLERERRAERERQRAEEEAQRVEAEEREYAAAEERRREAEESYRQEEAARLLEEGDLLRTLVAFDVARRRLLAAAAEQRDRQSYLDCLQDDDVTRLPVLSRLKTDLREAADAEPALLDRAELACSALAEHRLALRLAGDAPRARLFGAELAALQGLVRDRYDRLQLALYNSLEDIVAADAAGAEDARGGRREVGHGVAGAHFALGLWAVPFDNSGLRTAPVAPPGTDVLIEVPKTLFNRRLLVVARRRWLPEFGDARAAAFRVVEAPFAAACYEYPAESVQAGAWRTRRIHGAEEALRPLQLRAVDGGQAVFRAYVLLQPRTFLVENDALLAGAFDERDGEWRVDAAQQAAQEPTQNGHRCFCLEVPRMGLLGLFLRKSAEFPYLGFFLRTVCGRAQLTLQSARCTLHLEFEGGLVSLLPAESRALEDLVGRRLRVAEMLHQLALHNVQLAYALDELVPHLPFRPKAAALQAKAAAELPRLARRFNVQLSRWNRALGAHGLAVRVATARDEHNRMLHDFAEDWRTVVLYPNKVEALAVLDNSPALGLERQPGTVSHLSTALLVGAHPQAFALEAYDEQFADEEVLQIDAVSQFIGAVNLVALTPSAEGQA